MYNSLPMPQLLEHSQQPCPLPASGGKTDANGVPLNPVRSGLPMATDELAAFKLVGSALLMAYVEVGLSIMGLTSYASNMEWSPVPN